MFRVLIGLAMCALIGLAIWGVWRFCEQRKFDQHCTSLQQDLMAQRAELGDIRSAAIKSRELTDFLAKVCAEGTQSYAAQNAEILRDCDEALAACDRLRARGSRINGPAWDELAVLRSDVDAARLEVTKLASRQREHGTLVFSRGMEEARVRFGQTQDVVGAILQTMPALPETESVDALLDYLHRVVSVLYDLRVAQREMNNRRPLPTDVSQVIGPGSRVQNGN